MQILKTKPRGIDKPIQQLQQFLYGRLCTLWNIDPNGDMWRCYGRVYKNQDKDGYKPEVYIGGSEYKEVYHDDNHTVISFFDVGEIRNFPHAAVSVIFSLDIQKIKDVVHRGDEEIHQDVLDQLKTPHFGFRAMELVTGIDNVYSEYSLYKQHTGQRTNTEGIKYRDMHPLHCFRVNMDLNYDFSNC